MILHEDAYEEVAATFQCIQIDILNKVLKEHGVSDPTLRKEICGAYVFQIGSIFDQSWFTSEGKRYYPSICFSLNSLGAQPDMNLHTQVFGPSRLFSFHEYAYGNIDYYFDEHSESIPDLEVGGG